MKYTLSVLVTLALAFAAAAQPSPSLPPTRLAPGSGVTITTNGVNNFTIAASGGSSITNLGNGSNTLLATNLQVYSSGTTNGPLRVFGGAQTNSNPTQILNTWNNSGVTFTGFEVVATNTSAALGSIVARFGASDMAGGGFPLTVYDRYTRFGAHGAAVAYDARMENASGGTDIVAYDNNTRAVGLSYTGVNVKSSLGLLWWSGSAYSGSVDTAIYRNAAGIVEVNNGTAGQYRDLRLRTLQMYAQPSDPSSSATLGMIYAKTNAGTTEVFVMDGAGNVTQISPHARAASPAPPELDTDAQPIVIHHANLFLGTEEFLHLSALAKEVEKLSGKKFLYQRPLDPARKRDWHTEEAAIEQRHAAEHAADLERLAAWQSNTNQNKGPQPPVRPAYQKRPKPAWLP